MVGKRLTDIVNEIQIQEGAAQQKEVKMLLDGYDFVRRMALDAAGVVKQVQFDMPLSRQKQLPEDFVDWVDVNVCIAGGGWESVGTKTPTRIGAIVPASTTADGVSPLTIEQAVINTGYPNDNGWSNKVLERPQADKHKNFFVIDNGLIRFAPEIPDCTIRILYLSLCHTNEQETILHPYFIQACKAYITYRLDPTQARQYEYENEWSKAVVRQQAFKLQDLLDVFYTYTPRR